MTKTKMMRKKRVTAVTRSRMLEKRERRSAKKEEKRRRRSCKIRNHRSKPLVMASSSLLNNLNINQ